MIRKIIIGLSTIIVSALVGFFILFIICALPSGRAAIHVQESGTALLAEENYWRLIPSDNSSQLDNFTDCIMMLTSAYTGDQTAFDETIYSYRIYKKKSSKQESCQFCGLVPEDQKKEYTYEQYWHGYKIFLKPLLTFFNLSEIRTMNMYFILLCISAIVVLLAKHGLAMYIFPYLLGICFMNIPTVSQSLQFSNLFHITSITLIVLLVLWKYEWFSRNTWFYFLMTGICTSYVDFLTYPVITMAFPLIVLFALESKKGCTFFKAFKQLIGFSVSWSVGYIGMWASKWLIATIITKENHFELAIDKILERSSNSVGDTKFTIQEMMSVFRSYFSMNSLKYIIILFLVITLILSIVTKGIIQKEKWIISMVFLCISMYPFIWYLFARNHSYQHNFFTFRAMSVFCFGISALFIPFINGKIGKPGSQR